MCARVGQRANRVHDLPIDLTILLKTRYDMHPRRHWWH